MSYSRWSEASNWYIFWSVTDPDVHEPHLAIWHKSGSDTLTLPKSDIIKLRDCINEWLEDIEDE